MKQNPTRHELDKIYMVFIKYSLSQTKKLLKSLIMDRVQNSYKRAINKTIAANFEWIKKKKKGPLISIQDLADFNFYINLNGILRLLLGTFLRRILETLPLEKAFQKDTDFLTNYSFSTFTLINNLKLPPPASTTIASNHFIFFVC